MDGQPVSDAFAKKLELPFPLVGDPKGTIAKSYGVKWPLIPLARRATFLVGRDGRIRLALHSEGDPDRHVDEACAAARA